MSDTLTVSEHISSVWKNMIIFSVLLILIFSALFLIYDRSFWSGIYRFLAFVSFAILVLSALQIRGKTQSIEITKDTPNLVVNYFISTQKNQEEFFELETIEKVQKLPAPPVWGLLPRHDCIKFVISFKDTANNLSLFRFQGQDIFVSQNDAREIDRFLDKNLNG